MAVCPNCSASWTGLRVCHCSGCHVTFTSPSGFDAHQRWTDGVLACLAPAEVGLERRESGVWGYPPSEMPHFAGTASRTREN